MGFRVFLKCVNGAIHSDINWQIILHCWGCLFKSPITPSWFWPALVNSACWKVHVLKYMVVQHWWDMPCLSVCYFIYKLTVLKNLCVALLQLFQNRNDVIISLYKSGCHMLPFLQRVRFMIYLDYSWSCFTSIITIHTGIQCYNTHDICLADNVWLIENMSSVWCDH